MEKIYPFIKKTLPVVMLMIVSSPAFAQESQGLCQFASWLKTIATTAAVVAVFLFVMNSFFSKSSVIGDLILYVVIGCAVMVGASGIISLTGLTVTCNV